MPDPDPTKDQIPTQPEASKEDTSDETELTDEQLEKAAGGIALNGLDSGLTCTGNFWEITGQTEGPDAGTPRTD